jgi:hypothetical protein
MFRSLKLLLVSAVVLSTWLVTASSASADVVWKVQNNWAATNLPEGGTAQLFIQVRNMGTTDSTAEPIEVTIDLPPGVTTDIDFFDMFAGNKDFQWQCDPQVGTQLTCVLNESVYNRYVAGYFGVAPRLLIPIDIAPGTAGEYELATTVSGGGAATPAEDVDPITISATPAGFGMVPGSFEADLFEDRSPALLRERQAGATPYELRVDFDLNQKKTDHPPASPGFPGFMSVSPVERLKSTETILPRGTLGNPESVPRCTTEQFNAGGVYPRCPPSTQVGVIDTVLLAKSGWPFDLAGLTDLPVYNIAPPKGYVADFGFLFYGVRTHILAALDPANNYAIRAFVDDIPQPLEMNVRQVRLTMWGVPSDPRHFPLRHVGTTDITEYGAASDAPKLPFLNMPWDCGTPGHFKQRVEAYESAGQVTPYVDARGPEIEVGGCDDVRIRFEPEVDLTPTQQAAGSPTGLKVQLKVPQRNQRVEDTDDLYAPNGDFRAFGTPPMEKAVVTMPEGMTISTSAAQGLGSCSLEQISLGTNKPVTCPADSQYGTLTLNTPTLPEDAPMEGQIFIAKQNDNPFDSFLALYLVIQEPERGLLVKIPARLDLDPVTGQIKTTFEDLPQFPVSNMQMAFKGGVRAALVNPATCGVKTIRAEFYSWHDPDTAHVVTDRYEITRKPDGSPCVKSLGERPFRPQLSAGMASNAAGSYSPFIYRIQRTDDDQELSQLNVKLPPGLLAKISGIAKCPEAAIAAAAAPDRTGTAERSNPSCPAASQIGTTDVGSGVGQVLTYIPGKVYLAGPYKGAPLSMVVVTPILAGPYDLGVIAVRSRIDVDRETAQASVLTDPFPQIFKGIPVRIRDIRVKVDRERTMINPTNCNPLAIDSLVTGTGGDVNSTADDTAATLSQRFQAAGCGDLPFKPKLSFRLKGGTKRSAFPALTATLKARPGDANIARTAVTLPKSLFLAQQHIGTVCTRVQFAANECPPASVYGRARAVSPLFDGALEGTVYLRSNGGERLLPDLVVSLDGEIDIVLSGFIDSKNERIRNTFDVVPDAPVTSFTLSMFGGKKGLLENNRNLCKGKSRAEAKMTGQNGKAWNTRPVVISSCGKKGSKRRGR